MTRVALVTGAASGLGKETALHFLKKGYRVIGVDMTPFAYQDTHTYIADVTDRNSISQLVTHVQKLFGRLDVLVNCAGVTRDATLLKMTEKDFDFVIDVNLKGVFNLTQAFAPMMIEQQYGRIINISSIVALYGNFGQTNYVASKAGVIGMTQTWARELGRKGITVNAIAPGFMQTPMTEKMPRHVFDSMVEKVPVQRAGLPKDVAHACVFLADEQSSYINGHVLSVDGGLVF